MTRARPPSGMKLVPLSCASCGAPLEVPEDARRVTCRYCNARLQVEESESAVYTRVLESIDELGGEVRALRLQGEIERIDRELEALEAEEIELPPHIGAGITLGILGGGALVAFGGTRLSAGLVLGLSVIVCTLLLGFLASRHTLRTAFADRRQRRHHLTTRRKEILAELQTSG